MSFEDIERGGSFTTSQSQNNNSSSSRPTGYGPPSVAVARPSQQSQQSAYGRPQQQPQASSTALSGGRPQTQSSYQNSSNQTRQPQNPLAQPYGGGYQSSGYQGGRDGDAIYVQTTDRIAANLYAISNNVMTLTRMLGVIGSPKDTHEHREKVQSTMETTKTLIVETSKSLKVIGNVDGVSESERRERKNQQTKLTKDFQGVVGQYDTIQKQIVSKMKTFIAKSKEQVEHAQAMQDDFGGRDEQANLIQQRQRQEQLELDNEIEYNQALIEEREQGIKEIETTMMEVNFIMRDINVLLQEQGQTIDRIEDNIETAGVHVETGQQELIQAHRYQKSANKKTICILIVVVIAAAVIATITAISVKKG